jgi:hypothetical protein
VGKDLLLIFNDEKLHPKYLKWITNWSGCVLLNLKNPTQLTTLKMVEHSSHKWPPKFTSSMASMHKNVLGFTIPHHFAALEL